ncbi:hypothetical protein LCG56_28325 (plasmid) [Pseudomonas cannabina pv. alisalensis]|uniref:Uncharacterized protein n=1 Tax=Pseudomonas syringae pv. maculicola str. ES4326 TaxID=629265 RepID=A0A8T8CAH7_PSEYM|nr:hypothetical protein PMA4326_029695 [Pseudomonas syringae pv. maculicola str. ES4326]UBZ00279.1 hypothetical protein LCG56_28325 [Pseudomonas cannabina pv. alisalensis]
MPWHKITRALPVLPDREFLYARSEPVMVFLKWGSQRVARFVRYDEDGDMWSGRWISECRDSLDLTDCVTHWRDCYEPPTEGSPAECFCVEPEQIVRLRAITKRLYGDGSVMNADVRRDLANLLHRLLGEVADQPLRV